MKVAIVKRALGNSRFSLYLNYNCAGRRYRKALGIILERPVSKEIRAANRSKMLLAARIRNRQELAVLNRQYNISVAAGNACTEVVDAYDAWAADYRAKDHQTVAAARGALLDFMPDRHMWLSDVTHDFCRQFAAHLHTRYRGTTPQGYFSKFRAFLGAQVTLGVLTANPAAGVRLASAETTGKHALTFAELERLAATPCQDEEVKRAFLFSCNTGLRWCDVKRITPADIDRTTATLTVVQHKVAGRSRHARLHMPLNANAMQIITRKAKTGAGGCLFRLPSYTYMLRVLGRWVDEAGIGKHITYHCARHTFITHLIETGTNLATSASLAGHASTRHTERYIHLSDRQRAEAVNNFPKLPL